MLALRRDKRDDRRGRAANEPESFRFDLVKVPAALLYRSWAREDKSLHSEDMSVLESKMGKLDRFEPDITVEEESKDKTYRRNSAFSVMIAKILTDFSYSVELTRFNNFLGIDGTAKSCMSCYIVLAN